MCEGRRECIGCCPGIGMDKRIVHLFLKCGQIGYEGRVSERYESTGYKLREMLLMISFVKKQFIEVNNKQHC